MSGRGITDELIEHVKSFEGWSARPYLCPSGHPTIGYGRRVESLQVPNITLAQGEQMLREDLTRFRDMAIRLSPSLNNASERRLAAIVDFVYNAGPNNYRTSTLKKRVDEGNWAEAAVQIQRWVFGGNPRRILGGLVRRREAVAKWLLDG
jgi:lysozyme